MDREKIAIFEQIDSAFYPIVKKYLNEDFTIFFFEIDDKLGNKQRIKEYLEIEKLVDISKIVFEYILYKRAAFYAHENLDQVFEKYFSHSLSIKAMSDLLKFPELENMYKKELLLELERLYVLQLKINEIVKNSDSAEIHFFPCDNFKIYVDKSSRLMENIKVIYCNNLGIILNRSLCKTKKILLLLYSPYLFLKKIKKISNNKKRKEFKVGITIKHPENIFLMNYYTETIFIDDEELPKEDVLFIDESGQVNLKDYEKRGYNYTSLLNDREIISSNLFWQKIVKRFLPAWLKTIFLSLSENPLIIYTSVRILADYIKWNIFTDNYRIKNYIRRVIPDDISKVHILSQHNIKTWFIYPDNTSHDYYVGWDETKRNQAFFSFMHYDNAIIYGDIVERFLKKHRNCIGRYFKTGVFYSQISRELQEGKLKSHLPAIIKAKGLPGKIIAVFDTTFVDWGPVKIKDGIRFGDDILRLLDEFPDIGIIFKAKKEPALTPYLTSIYDKLKNHERCIFVARYDKEGISAPEVIAVSDFVISAAYTSTTAEALGAKKKAIYYDVAGHNIGDKYYFNRFPNFVAHSYEELKKSIHYWLYEVTDEDFEDFLNTYVKDEIDPYLDGKALTRLRKLLMET